MVGRLPDSGGQNRTQARVFDSRLRCRPDSQASAKASCGAVASTQSGETYADGNGDVRRLHRTILRAERASHTEAIHTQTVSLHNQLSPQTCIWSQASLRYLDSRDSDFCVEQVRLRFGMGSLQPSSQSDVEDFCEREEVGTLRWRQSGERNRSTREGRGSRENSTHAGASSTSVGRAPGTGSNDGIGRHSCRLARRRDSRPALAGRGSTESVASDSAGRLPGRSGISKDRQQTHSSLAGIPRGGATASLRDFHATGWAGIPYPHRWAVQRHQSASPSSQTGWQADRNPLGRLAYAQTDSRNPALASRSVPKGRSGAAWARTYLHHNGCIHATNSRPSTGSSREDVSIGDEW